MRSPCSYISVPKRVEKPAINWCVSQFIALRLFVSQFNRYVIKSTLYYALLSLIRQPRQQGNKVNSDEFYTRSKGPLSAPCVLTASNLSTLLSALTEFKTKATTVGAGLVFWFRTAKFLPTSATWTVPPNTDQKSLHHLTLRDIRSVEAEPPHQFPCYRCLSLYVYCCFLS